MCAQDEVCRIYLSNQWLRGKGKVDRNYLFAVLGTLYLDYLCKTVNYAIRLRTPAAPENEDAGKHIHLSLGQRGVVKLTFLIE